MKRKIVSMILEAVAVLLISGCASNSGPAYRAFVDGAGDFAQVVIPEYTAYVAADSSLTQPQRDRRARTTSAFSAALTAAEQELELPH